MSNLKKGPNFGKLVESAKRSFRKKPIPSYESPEEGTAGHSADDLIVPSPPRTNLFMWCCVILCSIFAILVIFAGLAVLIGYLAFHPHTPKFNVTSATLSSLLLDINFVLSANTILYIEAHNPNDKVPISYEYIKFELQFEKHTISTTMEEPFMQVPKNTTGWLVDMSSLAVQLEAKEAEDLSILIQKHKVDFYLEGTMRAKSKFGSITSIKYWMYTTCHLTFSPPPIGNGSLISHDCSSRR